MAKRSCRASGQVTWIDRWTVIERLVTWPDIENIHSGSSTVETKTAKRLLTCHRRSKLAWQNMPPSNNMQQHFPPSGSPLDSTPPDCPSILDHVRSTCSAYQRPCERRETKEQDAMRIKGKRKKEQEEEEEEKKKKKVRCI